MKYLYAILAVLFLSFGVNAQSFEVNFTNAVPTGDFSSSVNLGYMGGIALHVPFNGLMLVARGDYGFWDEVKNPSAEKFNFTNFPVVLAGARKYFGDFYLNALAGIYPVKQVTETADGKFESKETQGAIQAGFGYVFPLSFFHVDASVNYLWVQEYPQMQIGVGILFGR